MPNQPITWSTADPTIATVDTNGSIKPLRAGFTEVTASAGGFTATSGLSVRGPVPVPVRSNYAGINLSGIAYYSTQFPFVDLMKSGMGWTSMQDGVWGNPSDLVLTKDGYPAALKPGQQAMTAVAYGHQPTGRYTILWDGDGSISFPLNVGKVVTTEPHRIVLEALQSDGPMWLRIDRTNPADPVHNLRYLMPGAESTYATQPFNVEFLKKVTPFSVLRFMDWGRTNGSPVAEWADRSHLSDVTYGNANGVPIEVMLDLANTLHSDPWFCIPHKASDDYVRQFAALLKARLDPALKPHIEYSNEVWNTGFAQTGWAIEQSKKLGLDQPWGTPSLFYAQRATEMFKIIRQVYGTSDSSRVVRVIAGQAVWDQFLDNALGWKDTAANADVMAIAPYFGAAGTDELANVNLTLALTSDQIVDLMLADIRGPIKDVVTRNAALAKKYNLKLEAYESGSGVGSRTYAFPSDKHDALTNLFAQAHRSLRMHDVEVEYFNTWVANGGDTMNQFNDIGGWSKWGLWSLLETVDQDPATSPRYKGVMDFIAAHPTP